MRRYAGAVSGEIVALAITVLVHVIGAFALVVVLLRDSDGGWREWWPRDDDGHEPERPVGPVPGPSGDGLPLPNAAPARARLREPAHLGDAYPRPARRPAHAPEPAPVPERAGV